jgi:putative transposase
MKTRKAFRYRIYPTAEQEARLLAWQDALRWLWNLALEQRFHALGRVRHLRRYLTAFDQINELTALRKQAPWLNDVPRNVCAQLLVELDRTWQRCFKKLARQPRWKRKDRDWAAMCEPHRKLFRLEGSELVFPKLGRLRAVVHRPLEGRPKTCTISIDGDQWFASISCELEIEEPVRPVGPPVAIDRGVVNLLADDTGRVVVNPRWHKRSQKALARAQRVVSRRRKGSRNRQKAKIRVARLHRKVRRQRDHVLHFESTHYAKNHGTVIVEKLQIANMTRSAKGTQEAPGKNVKQKAGLNRSILDGGWGRFVSFLRYKSEWNGSLLVEVPAAFSSQTCAECASVDAKNRRSQSVFVCTACGHRAHADVNAARVLLGRGIHGPAACGGSADVRRPKKQELCVARRGPRSGSGHKAPSFRSG